MRRQRILERVGWRFWRCFASSFYRDREGVVADLIATLTRMGIQPVQSSEGDKDLAARKWVDHRVMPQDSRTNGSATPPQKAVPLTIGDVDRGLCIGDRVTISYLDTGKRLSFELTAEQNDLEKGKVSIGSPPGQALAGREENEEVEMVLDDGARRRLLIESVERKPPENAGPPTQASTVGPPV